MLFQSPDQADDKEAAPDDGRRVEARSRSLTDYSEEAIAKAVDQMIDQQIADGQFAETPLSFKYVEDIRRVFKERLSTINHHRIAYPTLNR